MQRPTSYHSMRQPSEHVVRVGIGEAAITNDPTQVLAAFSLGSCVGVTIHCKHSGIGALLHAQLPLSQINPDDARNRPFRYTDSGIVAVLETLLQRGASRRGLRITMTGGSSVLDPDGRYRIGERNQAVVRKILWKNNLLLAAEDVGGEQPRSIFLHVADGTTIVRSRGQERRLT